MYDGKLPEFLSLSSCWNGRSGTLSGRFHSLSEPYFGVWFLLGRYGLCFPQKRRKRLDKGRGGGYNNWALESPAQLRPEAQYFFRKLKKVLDLWRKLCYINQAVGDDGVKDREAECTL